MQYQNQGVPNEWICPITQELMNDPVIADDGFSYQRKSLEDWFKTSKISPITGLVLASTKVIPNRALKNTIDQYLQKTNKIKNQFQDTKSASKVKQKMIKIPNIPHQNIQQNLNLRSYYILDQNQENFILNLEILPPQKSQSKFRKPISLVCILDTSDSMNIDAEKDIKQNERHGFSRLDLVRHSMNTLIQFMNDGDELTLITFNTAAQCILRTTKMNAIGKQNAVNKIKNLQGTGTTNIWQGLRISLEMLKNINHKNKNVFTILLTDGQPNLNPPRGIVPTLKKYIDIEQLINPNFHVFGYGYQLDTKLLEQIARIGAGSFSYIPDCSMVGTVFVNFMANCLSTITNRLQLQVQFSQNLKTYQIIGFSQFKPKKYNLGCIQYGQKRNISLKIPKNKCSEGYIKFQISYGSQFKQTNILEVSLKREQMNIQNNQNLLIRFKYLQLLNNCIGYGSKFQMALNDIKAFYYFVLKQQKNEYTETLLKQLKSDNDQNLGQVEKAFLKQEWYKKWGKTYIPSLLLAHLMQVCTNFKDPLLQLYGGQMFKKYQNQMDTIFIKMKPPKPSAKKQKNIVYKPQPVDMGYYYNNYGGCIDGECEVLISRKNEQGIQYFTKQKLKNIKKGDKIGQNRSQIVCMVQTRIYSWVYMVKLENLTITPWHPIVYNGRWVFPIDLKPSQKVYIQSYFNFVTVNSFPVQIESVQCISLGHQISSNNVTNHEYLSTKKVINDLQQSYQNFQKGHLVIRKVKRDRNTGKISKFIVS